MSILITGINGFIGKNLSRILSRSKRKVIPSRGGRIHIRGKKGDSDWTLDVTNEDSLKNYQDEKIDYIIHLAAKTSIEDSVKNPYSTFFTNVVGTLNLLEFARTKHVKNFIFISTYLYGKPEYLPIDENHPLKPHSPYNSSKLIGEKMCENYAQEYGLNVVSLRPFCIYGPDNKASSLVQKAITAINKSEVMVLSGLKTRRDFLYVDDLVELIIKIIDNFPNNYNVYNVGYGVSYNIGDVAKRIALLLNKEVKIQYKKSKENEILDMTADISKVSKEFDWKPQIDLHSGLKLIVKELFEQ
jgi:UDP-glucose 4-epimerase